MQSEPEMHNKFGVFARALGKVYIEKATKRVTFCQAPCTTLCRNG